MNQLSKKCEVHASAYVYLYPAASSMWSFSTI